MALPTADQASVPTVTWQPSHPDPAERPASYGLGLLEPAIEFAAALHQPDDRTTGGVLTIGSDGLDFVVGPRAAQADPYGETTIRWQWTELARVDFAERGSTGMRFFGGRHTAQVTATSRSGSTTTLEVEYDSYTDIEEAAFCVAAATDTFVTLDSFEVTAEEAAAELDRLAGEEQVPHGGIYGQPIAPDGPPYTPPYAQQYAPPYAQTYQAPQYGYGYPAVRPSTNGFAIASLVCAFFFSPLGLAFGLVAKSQIKRSGESGGGLATAGIVISSILMALTIVAWIALAIAVSHVNQ